MDPRRSCIACRRSLPKGELLRLVRAADGRIVADPAARAEGRGAYVCSDPECAASLAQGRSHARSLRAPVTVEQETIDVIHERPRSASTR